MADFEKVVRDGKVAILVSPGFGAGWSTWGRDDQMEFLAFDSRLVEMVEQDRKAEIEPFLKQLFPDDTPYLGGLDGLEVQWLEQGRQFYVHEYDGSEWLVTTDDLIWTA